MNEKIHVSNTFWMQKYVRNILIFHRFEVNSLKEISSILSISWSISWEGSRNFFNLWSLTLKVLPSLSWKVIAPCVNELTTVYGPFHLLQSFPSPKSLTLELNRRTLSPLNSFWLIWWSCHLFVLSFVKLGYGRTTQIIWPTCAHHCPKGLWLLHTRAR